jgi:hypothetical protein
VGENIAEGAATTSEFLADEGMEMPQRQHTDLGLA